MSDNVTLSEMTDRTVTSPHALPSSLVDEAGDRARAYVRAARAENTRRAYAADWRSFTAWAASAGLTPLPASPETLGLYLAAEAARLRPGTLARHLVTITAAHRAAGHQLNTRASAIRETLTGIKRTHGTSQTGKAPASVADLKAMIEAQPDTLTGLRNRALLLLGFAGALRRSELVSLDVSDLDFTSDGLVVNPPSVENRSRWARPTDRRAFWTPLQDVSGTVLTIVPGGCWHHIRRDFP